MKKTIKLLAATALLLSSNLAFAEDSQLFSAVPDLLDYFAMPGKSKPLYEPRGGYIGIKGLFGNVRYKGLDVALAPFATTVTVPPVDNVQVYGGAVQVGYNGKNYNNVFPNRFELEYSFRTFNVAITPNQALTGGLGTLNKIATDTHLVMFNVYNDFNTSSRFIPYVGAGLGLAIHEGQTEFASLTKIKGTSTELAWTLRVGVRYQLTNELDFDIAYEYTNLGKPEYELSDPANGNKFKPSELGSSSVMVGVTWQIGEDLGLDLFS